MDVNKLVDNIFNNLNKDVVEALETDVTEIIEDTQTEVIFDKVYENYTPVVYKRRYENDGIIDRENMNGNVVGNNGTNITYIFENDTKTNPYDDYYLRDINGTENLLDMYDEMTMGHLDHTINISQETLNELEKEDLINKTIKKSLKSKGYNVK